MHGPGPSGSGTTPRSASPSGPTGWSAILVPAFFADLLDLPVLLQISLWVLAIASTVTVVQRIWVVRRQALAEKGAEPGPRTGSPNG